MSATTERLHAFDSLRGAMMLLGLDQQRSALFDLLVCFIHNFRMPLFFLLAGFFGRMVLEKLDWQGFLRHRLLRLGVPLVYAWFYGVGWMLFPLRQTLEEWTRPAWKQVLLAGVARK